MKFYKVTKGESVIKIFRAESVDDYITYTSDTEYDDIEEIDEQEYKHIVSTGDFNPVDEDGNDIIDNFDPFTLKLNILDIMNRHKFVDNVKLLDEIYSWMVHGIH